MFIKANLLFGGYNLKIKKSNKILDVIIIITAAVVCCLTLKFSSISTGTSVDRNLPIYCVDTNEKKVALSFDVSWGTDYTKKILDTLDKYNVKATFFIVGGWIDKNPDIVTEIYKRGHEIGNHSNMHPDMTRISRSRIIEEIDITDAKIRKITGTGTTLFRCPGGSYNDNAVSTIKSTGHFCVQWNVDSIDWMEQGADIEYNRVVKKLQPGSIILFHNTAKYTPDNLPRIIQEIRVRGYNFVKVGDLIYKDNFHINSEGKQIMD